MGRAGGRAWLTDGLRLRGACGKRLFLVELRVVAEGVETQDSWDRLAGLGCDLIQATA